VRKIRATALWASLVLLVGPACGGSQNPGSSPRSNKIIIGAFNFSESRALAHVYATALKQSGFEVDVLGEVASREIMEPALEQGQIDIVPEYLGTALTFIDPARSAHVRSAVEAHDFLSAAFERRGISVMSHAPGQNRNEIVVTQELAEEYSLDSISDLRDVASELSFGGPPECPARPLCLGGLERTYGLSFKDFIPLDPGGPETVAALTGGEIDVALLFTTNPRISREGLVVLEDDKRLQPPENVVPVIRSVVAQRHGASLQRAIDSVTERLTDDSLRRLNESVELDGLSPEAAAVAWLAEEGLTP
jgi:osmoprotectant transport system substrate-binding protein